METIKVGDIYTVTQISKNNNEPWIKLIEIAEGRDTEVLFDFDGIELEEPFNNPWFMRLIANTNVHIKIYCAEETKNTIELACKLGLIETGRVHNENRYADECEEDKETLAIEAAYKRIMERTTLKSDKVIIGIEEIFSFLADMKTVRAIDKIISDTVIKEDIQNFDIAANEVHIPDTTLEQIANMIFKYEKDGVTVKLITDDDTSGKLYLFRGNRKIGTGERIKLFESNIAYNTVGIVSRYKKTKTKDRFGRYGEGEPIQARVAIYKGIHEGKVKLLTFNKRYFATKQDYYLDNNGAILENLVTNEWNVPIEDIGLCDKSIGSLYHFNLPIQYLQNDYINYNKPIKDTQTGGIKFKTEKKTLPEYVKMVLDDFNISYNAIALMDAIRQTKIYLNK